MLFLDYLSNPIVLFVVFVLFLIVAKSVFQLLAGALVIAGLGAVFPFVLVKIFGYPMQLGLKTSLIWALIGTGVYFIWAVLNMMYQATQVMEFVTQTMLPTLFFPFVLLWKGIKAVVWIDDEKKKDEKKK